MAKDSELTKSQKILYRIQKGAIKGLAHLPLSCLYGISDLGTFILRRVMKYREDMIRKNMRNSFPDASEEQIEIWRNDFYQRFCDVFVEAAKLAHISDKEMARRVKVTGAEEVNKSLKAGKSVILLLGHFGNWEWVTYGARHFLPEAISCEIYHPLSDKVFDKVMLDLRSRFGTVNIPMANTMRTLLGYHRSGRQFVCGFISDQRPFTLELTHWTDFLNQDTPYVNGGEVLGKHIGADFFYVEMMPERRGYYHMTLERIEAEDDGEENPFTRAFLKKLEASIRKNPPAWLWSHNRWKRKRGE